MKKLRFFIFIILFISNAYARATISSAQAKQIAEREYEAEVLSLKLEQAGTPGAVYRVKIIKGGKIRTISIPAYAK